MKLRWCSSNKSCTIRSSIAAFRVADPGFKSRPEHRWFWIWRPFWGDLGVFHWGITCIQFFISEYYSLCMNILSFWRLLDYQSGYRLNWGLYYKKYIWSSMAINSSSGSLKILLIGITIQRPQCLTGLCSFYCYYTTGAP